MADKDKEEYFEEFQNEKLDYEKLKKAENKASKLGEVSGNFLLMVKMAKDAISGDFKLTGGEMAILIGAIVYVISPIDAIPDIIPVLGWTDDIGIVGIALKKLSDALDRYKRM